MNLFRKLSKKAGRWLGRLALATCLSLGLQATSQTANAPASSDGDKTWKEVQKLIRPPMPPAEWQGKRPTPEQVEAFRAEQGKTAGEAAEKLKDFYTRFPNHPKAQEAREREYDLLEVAVELGNTNKLAALEARAQDRLKDPKLSEAERFKLRFHAVQRAVALKEPEGDPAMLAEQEKGARELIRDFPKREESYHMLLEVASESEPSKGRTMAKEIAAGAATEEIKAAAQGLLKKLDALGKPLPIKFTALDGREVDLGKLKGKVVLVDFWATWCGPCVAEVPNVKKTYDELHPKGFEIVGISFDTSKEKLTSFVAKEGMKWPQYFDGKQWQNKFGQEYGINSIPAMWLVDKKGNLRDMNARAALEEKVGKLLAE